MSPHPALITSMTIFGHISTWAKKELQFLLNCASIFSRSKQNRINAGKTTTRNATIATSICRFKQFENLCEMDSRLVRPLPNRQLRKTLAEGICDLSAAEQAA